MWIAVYFPKFQFVSGSESNNPGTDCISEDDPTAPPSHMVFQNIVTSFKWWSLTLEPLQGAALAAGSVTGAASASRTPAAAAAAPFTLWAQPYFKSTLIWFCLEPQFPAQRVSVLLQAFSRPASTDNINKQVCTFIKTYLDISRKAQLRLEHPSTSVHKGG